MDKLPQNIEYQKLIENISFVFTSARQNVASAVNLEMLNAYWNIGKGIVEFEQKGEQKSYLWKKTIRKPIERLEFKVR
jgi:hypothetical protein